MTSNIKSTKVRVMITLDILDNQCRVLDMENARTCTHIHPHTHDCTFRHTYTYMKSFVPNSIHLFNIYRSFHCHFVIKIYAICKQTKL